MERKAPLEKPRLLIVTEVYPKNYQSYMGIYVHEQLQELKKIYRITVITTFEESFFHRPKSPHPTYINNDNVEVHYIRYYPSWLWFIHKFRIITIQELIYVNKKITAKKITKLSKLLHRKSPFTLVHGHETYLGDEAGPIGKLLNIPSVFTLHGWYAEHVKNFGTKVVNKAISNIKVVTRLIADSKRAAESYEPEVHRKFTVIANGAQLVDNPILPKKIQDFCNNDDILLSVGSFSPSKRFSISLECLAFAHTHGYPSTKLILVGKGVEKSSLILKSIELELSNHVLFLQDISRETLSAIINRSTIVVHPSRVDAFSLICLEGMSAGKAVIADERIGIMEFVHPGIDIISIPANHPEQFRKNVVTLLNQKEMRKKIGNAALQTSKKFQWPTIAERIQIEYLQALNHE